MERKLDVDAGMGKLLVPLGNNLMLTDPCAAPRAPGHRVEAPIDPAPLINEKIRKAMKKLGIESHEDIYVEVSMDEEIILTVRVGPVNPGFVQ